MTEETKTKEISAPQLDLNDLVAATQLIAAAIKRGAFEPSELVAVGQTHEKLASFLQYQAQMQEAKKAAEAADADAKIDAEADSGDEE